MAAILVPTGKAEYKALGVARIRRQHAGVDTHERQSALVFIIQPTVENQLFRSGAVQPAIVGDLVFQLARPPAGIAQHHGCPLRAAAVGNGADNIERCRQGNIIADGNTGFAQVVIGMQHEAAPGLDRPATLDRKFARAVRQHDGIVAVHKFQMQKDIGKGDLLRPVDDEAHGARIRMSADVDHRAGKIAVIQSGHRDEELTIEKATFAFVHQG
ncbi:hypothetical protein AT6N2_C1668 [Agrobacterium tumefaciens]|nr:hypothetical protein AT6N2_C1668 [Agrobacterium tumefaciens]